VPKLIQIDDLDQFLTRRLKQLESFCFRYRLPILAVLAAFTVFMGYFALQLRMDAGFEKQMPSGHEYTETFNKYRDDVLGANRLNVVVKARQGSIWTRQGLTRLYEVTQPSPICPASIAWAYSPYGRRIASLTKSPRKVFAPTH
jgi:hypothetical protein